MSEPPVPDDKLKDVLGDVKPSDRRSSPRYATRGTVEFHRPLETDRHTGRLVDISEGGLSFVTKVPLPVGETLHLTYEEEGRPRSTQATVETVHATQKEAGYVVGAKFVR